VAAAYTFLLAHQTQVLPVDWDKLTLVTVGMLVQGGLPVQEMAELGHQAVVNQLA
jgi:hypothetical protein